MTTIADRASAVAADLSPTDKIAIHRTGQAGGQSLTMANAALYLNGGAALATNNPVANMVGDGVTDNLAAWNSLKSQYQCVVIPEGEFLFSQPMDVPNNRTIQGMGFYHLGQGGTRIKGTSGQLAAMRVGAATDEKISISDLKITGAADVGFLAVAGGSAGFTGSRLRRVGIEGTFDVGFQFGDTFDCILEDLSVANSTIADACFRAETNFNANVCSHWHTSQAAPYNFYIGHGHGNTFNNLVAQVGTIGLFVGGSHRESTFNSFYSENVVTPCQLGVASTSLAAGITFNSASFAQPSTGHSGYADRITCLDLQYARSCTFVSPSFEGCYNAYSAVSVALTGGGGSGAQAVARVHPDGNIHSVHVVRAGTGYTAAPSVGFSGGGGTGATATSALSGDGVVSVTVTAGGAGYSANEANPSAVRLNNVRDVTFIAPRARPTGQDFGFYFAIVTSGSNTAKISVIGTTTNRQGAPSTAAANMIPANGYSYQHYLQEYNSSGTLQQYGYVPPAMTT